MEKKSMLHTVQKVLAATTIGLLVYAPTFAQTPTKAKITVTPTTAKTKVTTTPTETPAPTTKLEKDVQLLKDKIATKVAEMRDTSKSTKAGTVTNIEKDIITIQTEDGATTKITYDDTVTKLVSLVSKGDDLKLSDIKKGDYLVVSGLAIEDSLTATIIYKDQQFLALSGKVSDVQKADFEITVITTGKDTYTLDIESSTKQSIFDYEEAAVIKSGFSKIHVGDTINFVIKKSDGKTATKATAIRTLIIPQEYFTQVQK